MKKLKGHAVGDAPTEMLDFECDHLVLHLDHGRSITIRRGKVHGADGILLACGIESGEENGERSLGYAG